GTRFGGLAFGQASQQAAPHLRPLRGNDTEQDPVPRTSPLRNLQAEIVSADGKKKATLMKVKGQPKKDLKETKKEEANPDGKQKPFIHVKPYNPPDKGTWQESEPGGVSPQLNLEDCLGRVSITH